MYSYLSVPIPSLFFLSASFYDLDICEQSRLHILQRLLHYEFLDFPNARIKVTCFGRNTIEVMLWFFSDHCNKGSMLQPNVPLLEMLILIIWLK